MQTEVLIVGLGPVGAALANLLGTYGVSVVVAEATRAVFPKPRAIALDNEALRILQLVGIKDGELPVVGIPEVVYISPAFGQFARVDTSAIVDGHPSLVTFVQPQLEALLRKKLAGKQSVRVELGATLEGFEDRGDGVRASFRRDDGDEFEVQARYLVGADGANSFVRRALGLDFTGQSYAEDWLIVDAINPGRPCNHIEFICDPRRPTPHMPAPEGRQRWEFKLHAGESREEFERPDNIKKLLAPFCDDPEKVTIERTAVYRFHARCAPAFSKGRCFLAGDAAHITPPFAGQGLVSGLRDAANLAWKLAWVVRGRASPAILDSYTEERQPHALAMINLARMMGAVVMPTSWIGAAAVHGTIAASQLLIPGARSYFEDLKIKPAPSFPKGLFARTGTAKLVPGAPVPQGYVRASPSSTPTLSDDALGPSLCLIGYGVDPASVVDSALLARLEAAGGRAVQYCHRSQALNLGPAEARIEALDGAVLPGKVPLGWVAVVRPDWCVMCEGPGERAAEVLERALGLLQGEGREKGKL